MKIVQAEFYVGIVIGVIAVLNTTTAHFGDSMVDAMKDFVELETYFDQKVKALDYKLKGKEAEFSCFAQGPTVVTFEARLTDPDVLKLSSNALVKFNEVLENVGNGFEIYSGVFSAPVKGLYHFSANAREAYDGFLYLGLYKDDDEMVKSVARRKSSLTVNVSVILDKSDRVYLKNTRTSTSYIFGRGETFFTGHLVKRLG